MRKYLKELREKKEKLTQEAAAQKLGISQNYYNAELKEEIYNTFDNVVEYKHGDNSDRVNKVNSFEDIRFRINSGNKKNVDIDNKQEAWYDEDISIPYNEKRQLNEYIMRKNNEGNTLADIGCKEIGNNFYIWKNNSITDYSIVLMTKIDGNENLIDFMREKIKNGTFRTGKGLRDYVAQYNGGFGTRYRSGIADTGGRAEGGNGAISYGERTGDGFRSSVESSRNTQKEQKTKEYRLNSTLTGINSTDEYIRSLEFKNAALSRANKLLKQYAESLSINTDDVSINKYAGELRAQYKSSLKAKDIAAEISDILSELKSNFLNKNGTLNEKAYSDAFGKLSELAKNLLENSKDVDSELYDEYKPLIEKLRKTGVSISERDSADIPDFNDWRRANMGKILIKNDGVPIDSFYQELSEEYPEFFSVDIVHPAEQLQKIAEVRNSISKKSIYAGAALEETSNSIASEIIGKFLRDDSGANKQNVIEAIKKEFIDGVKAEYAQAFEKQKAEYKSKLDQYWKDREIRKLRERTFKNIQKLQSLSKKQYTTLPEETVRETERILSDYDSLGIGILDKGYLRTDKDGNKIQVYGRLEIEQLIDQIKQESGNQEYSVPLPIQKMIDRLNHKQISDLSTEELIELNQLTNALVKQYQRSKEIFINGKRENIKEASTTLISQINKVDKKDYYDMALTKYGRTYINYLLSPMRFLRRINGYTPDGVLIKLGQEMQRGEIARKSFIMKTDKFFAELTSDKEYIKFCDEKTKWIDTGIKDANGKPVRMTEAMIASLAAHIQNEDNLNHIMGGGVIIPRESLWRKGKTQEAISSADDGVVLTLEQCREIINNHLSDYGRQWVDRSMSYFSGMCKTAVNYRSQKELGYDIARVDKYFPIRTARDYLHKEDVASVNDALYDSHGFTKERVKGAITPIVLLPIDMVVANQRDNVAQYYGLESAVRDFNKVMAYSSSMNGSSVRRTIRNKWGESAINYIDNMIADVQNARTGNSKGFDLNFSKAMSKIIGGTAKSTLNFNVRVALAQAASYPTAGAVIDMKYLVKALNPAYAKKVIAKTFEEIDKHTPLLAERRQGLSLVELGDFAKEKNSNFTGKMWGSGWIQKVDTATVKQLWYACELQVQGEHKNDSNYIGSKEYFKEVTKLYTEATLDTQPQYGQFERPEILRSKNPMARMFTMYKTQPLQNIGLCIDAAGEYSAAKKSGDVKWKKAAFKKLKNVAVSQLIQTTLYTALKMLVDAAIYRKDEKYKDDELKKYDKTKILKDFALGFSSNAIGGLVLLSSAYEYVMSFVTGKTFYTPQDPGLSAVEDFLDAVSRVKNISLSDDVVSDKDMQKINNLAKATSSLIGVPLNNIEKLVGGIFYSVEENMNKAGISTVEFDSILYGVGIGGTYSRKMLDNISAAIKNQKESYIENPTGKNAIKYEKYARINSYISNSKKLISQMPRNEQRGAWVEMIKNIRKQELSFTESDKMIASTVENAEDFISKDSYRLPEGILSKTEDGKEYQYVMTISEYNEYLADLFDKIETQRKTEMSREAYKASDNAAKNKILKEADSEAKKAVKKDYVSLYQDKFEPVEKDND